MSLSAAGTINWTARMTGASNDSFSDASFDAAGNVYASGIFNGCCPTGSTTLTTSTGSSVGIAPIGAATGVLFRISPSGTINWNARIGNRDASIIQTVYNPSSAQLYLTASVRFWGGAATFVDALGQSRGFAQSCAYENCPYLIALSAATGAFQWVLPGQFAGDAMRPNDVAVAGGKPHLLLQTGTPVSFSTPGGGSTVTIGPGGGADHRFLVRFGTNGAPEASTSFSSTSLMSVGQFTAAADGRLYVANSFSGAISAGGQTASATGSTDGVLVAVSPSLTASLALQLTGAAGSSNRLSGVAVAPDGSILVAGYATAGGVIQGRSITSTGGLLYWQP
jgi:hypothetical protein